MASQGYADGIDSLPQIIPHIPAQILYTLLIPGVGGGKRVLSHSLPIDDQFEISQAGHGDFGKGRTIRQGKRGPQQGAAADPLRRNVVAGYEGGTEIRNSGENPSVHKAAIHPYPIPGHLRQRFSLIRNAPGLGTFYPAAVPFHAAALFLRQPENGHAASLLAAAGGLSLQKIGEYRPAAGHRGILLDAVTFELDDLHRLHPFTFTILSRFLRTLHRFSPALHSP